LGQKEEIRRSNEVNCLSKIQAIPLYAANEIVNLNELSLKEFYGYISDSNLDLSCQQEKKVSYIREIFA